MNLPEFAIRYRPVVITLSVLMMIWGTAAYYTMPRREDPEYTVRTCAVITSWPGAPARKVEELITDKLEEALDTIEEVKVLRSTSTSGLSEIYVDTEDSVSAGRIDNVWDKVRARVDRVTMPEPGIKPVVNDEFGDVSILLACVYQRPLEPGAGTAEQPDYSLRQLELFADQVRDSLRLIPGVSKAEKQGVVEEAIYLETDFATWSQIDLTIAQLQRLLEARNTVAPGGEVDTSVGRFSLKPGGEFNAIDEIESIVVHTGETADLGRPIYLRDVGLSVRRDYADPPRRICRYGDARQSYPCVVVALQMKSGANIIDICEAAKQRVAAMQQQERSLPPDIAVGYVSDQSLNVRKKIDDVVGNVIGAIIIVVVTVYLFVGFRTAGVMAANIPVVILASIALMTLFGVQLEQISLASIIIALGLLVDNAVQVCDQARSNQMGGMDPVQAATVGARQLTVAMLTGTITTVAAFLPMLIALDGSNREYVYSLPVTLTATLGVSWLLAMTFCVILAAAFIRAPRSSTGSLAPLPWLLSRLRRRRPQPESISAGSSEGTMGRLLSSAMRAAIRAKFVTSGVALLLFIAACALPVGSEFFPKDLRDQFAIKIWLPQTATLEQSDAAAMRVEEILRKLSPTGETDDAGRPIERINSMRTMIGGGGARWYLSWDPEGTKPNFAEILVRTNDPYATPFLARRVREIAERGDAGLGLPPVAGARVIPAELYLGPSKPPVELRVMGSGFANMQTLRRVADEVKALIRAQPGVWDVNDTWGVPGFQLRVDIDQDKANLAGVTSAQVAQSLNAYFSGHQLTTYREGDHLVPVYLRLGLDERERLGSSLEGLSAAFVEGYRGKVPLESIATIEPRWEPARIERYDMNRKIDVRSEVEPGVRGNDVVLGVLDSPEFQRLQASLPPGFWIEVGGTLEKSRESMERLSLSLGISLLLIVLTLVVQYNGWAKPAIILTTLPLALIGALPGLYLTGEPLGFMPQLGILSLFGIVLNSAIIFFEFADVVIAERAIASDGAGPICGLTRPEFRECLVEAGRQRLLPIFLTTATTIGGLLPLAISGGPLWRGMAWCMISGLTVATALTLLVVPALYAILVETFRIRPVQLPPRPLPLSPNAPVVPAVQADLAAREPESVA